MAHVLGRPWAPAAVGLLALLLLLPSVDDRLVLDDHVLMLQQREGGGVEGLRHRPFDLFTFTTGDAADNREMIEHGVLLPWWSHPELRIAFLRPLSSLTHHVDGWLWPRSPAAMHLHSLVWYGLLLLVVASLYRAWIAPRWVAVLALLLYAIDDAHGATVGWIANRNALVGLALALPALHLHARHRRSGEAWPLAAAVGLFAVALLAGEMALSVLGYLVAYALWLDGGRPARRALSVAPYVAVVVLWRVAYHALGYGAVGSGGYHDPGREPLAFAGALITNFPLLLGAQLGLPVADHAFWGEAALRPLLLALALSAIALVVVLAPPLLRRDPTARFWATGMVLAAVPVAASVPGERLLLGVGVGAAALIAQLLGTFAERGRAARAGLVTLAAVHVVLAAALLPVRAHSMAVLGSALDAADASLAADADLEGRSVIVVAAPLDIFASYVQVRRAQEGAPRPPRLTWLSTASSALTIERPSATTLRITPDAGFIATPPERHYRSPSAPFRVGDEVALPDYRAIVRATTEAGRPTTVDFEFPSRLEDAPVHWRTWRDGRYVKFSPPPVGQIVRAPGQDLYGVLRQHLARRSSVPPVDHEQRGQPPVFAGAGAD
jgi:hypothetical protein